MRKVFRLLRIDLAIKKYKRAESQTLPPCINSSPKVGRTCPRTPCSSLFFRKKKKKKIHTKGQTIHLTMVMNC
jgi:hypothetical protein